MWVFNGVIPAKHHVPLLVGAGRQFEPARSLPAYMSRGWIRPYMRGKGRVIR